MRRLTAAGLVAAVLTAAPAGAQDPDFPTVPSSSILVVDPERLYFESAFGKRLTAEIEARSVALSDENRQIEAQLVAEERELTELRDETPAEEFAILAAEFDEKVRRLRAEQDAKVRALTRQREEVRQDFFRRAAPVLSDLLRDRNATALLDRRAIFLTLEGVEITAEAVARIDAALGDGTSGGGADEN